MIAPQAKQRGHFTMAEEIVGSILDNRAMLADEIHTRANQLAAILNIPPATFEGKEAEAYQIMGHLAAMPALREFDKRRAYGIEVLKNCDIAFPHAEPALGVFFHYVQIRVAEMQEFPGWFHNLSDSNDDLVENYVVVSTIVDAMKYAGLVGAGGLGFKAAAGAAGGAGKSIETGKGPRGIATGAWRGGREGLGKALTGGLTTRAGIFVWLAGQLTYTVLVDEQREMRREIIRRYQEGKLSQALYQRALGTEIPPPARYFYQIR